MTDYERELMEQGVYLTRRLPSPGIKMVYADTKTKRPVSPYAKFDKYHKKKRK